MFVSVNGCSLKTEENLAAIKAIDLQRIMFETGKFSSSVPSRPAHIQAERCSVVFHDFHTCIEKAYRQPSG